MIRDKLKDKEYFETFLTEQVEDLLFYQNKLSKAVGTNESKAKVTGILKRAIFTINFQMLVARYSRGDSLALIKEDYINSIPAFKEAFSGIIDMNNLQFIALSVLLNVNLFEDKKFIALLEKFEVSHGVIDILMNKENVSDVSHYQDIRRFRPWVAELYQKPDEREAIISKQLSNWYKSQRSSYFFGYDKEKEPLYFGYWALEIGALVKILKIPDDSFKDKKYYPYDLVHFGG